jgi:hypothetical protein
MRHEEQRITRRRLRNPWRGAWIALLPIAAIVLAIIVTQAAAVRADAAADSFDSLVRSLRSQDNVEVTTPPMMWLARIVVKAAQPEGVMDVRLATFEGRGLSRVAGDESFNKLLQRVADQGWSPLVRVRSRRSGEVSAVHVRQHRGQLSLLVVAIDRGEGVIVEAAVKPEALGRWLDKPRWLAKRTHGNHGRDRDRDRDRDRERERERTRAGTESQ